MSVQFQIEETPEYLAVRFTGATGEASEQFELIAEHCNRSSKHKLLLDFTHSYGEISLAERYWLGDRCPSRKLYMPCIAFI